MNGSAHAAASAAAKVPAYCSGWAHSITPAQWTQCWKIGWSQPSTTAAKAGYYTGHNIAPVLAVIILAVLVLAWFRRGKRASQPAPAPRARERAGARR
jgi:hypothetical protein